ncbi:hypothetical protein TNCV_1115161 [Trichonephila clavipes]|nr:hypothetical protein TNCV_1115161 [Trichonephila clavipes]
MALLVKATKAVRVLCSETVVCRTSSVKRLEIKRSVNSLVKQLEERVELATTAFVMSSHAPPLSTWTASPLWITQVDSTASLSEYVQLHSAGRISNQHQVSQMRLKGKDIFRGNGQCGQF